jgi:type II restriction/modification system DNA methylase subunit YeeA
MTSDEFIATWTKNDLTERAGAQAFIEDLCRLLDIDPPRDSETFCYEKGAMKDSGKRGWADVWKKDHFAWENKKPGSDLKRALTQLREYSGNLDNPPLLIVSDRERIEIHTAFRGYPDEPIFILLSCIDDPRNLHALHCAFTDPDKLKPLKSNAAITAEAAAKFAYLASEMRKRGLNPQVVAHFLTQCVFCMFAEDEELLHASPTEDKRIFTSLLRILHNDPIRAVKRMTTLFNAMQKKGSSYGNDDIAWFNGGLFKTIDVPPLNASELRVLFAATNLDWRAIDPTIFGTLFERGLDPNCRAQLGAHYTDVSTINKLIEPLIIRPLAAKWQSVKVLLEKSQGRGKRTDDYKNAVAAYQAYLDELHNFRVLDAACGSGNFLYLALHALKDLEHRAQLDAEILGFEKQIIISTGTHNVLGLETNEYAAELARVTVWIGDIQWCQRNGRPINKNPILSSLDSIEHRDALINEDGTEAQWPEADVIVGNPPFLGGSKKRRELGDVYFDTLAKVFPKERVPAGADLVCYWFDKARVQIEQGKAKAAGLVSTNSIRGGANRTVLDNICKNMPILEAWSDEDWFDNGTAVRVSLVCFGHRVGAESSAISSSTEEQEPINLPPYLNARPVALIHADLTAGNSENNMDLTSAKPIKENAGASFQGSQKIGAFDIDGDLARQWLKLPNVSGKANSEVLKPSWNGIDVTRRPRDGWIIDFGTSLSEENAGLYEAPFNYVVEQVKPVRIKNPRPIRAKIWWRHGDGQPAMRAALADLPRYMALSSVTKHIFWRWLDKTILPDKALIVIARADDTYFGILNSRFHELWSLALCTSLEDRPRYTPTTCFETFPFPEGLSPADTNNSESKIAILDSTKPTPEPVTNPETMIHAQAIAAAAFKLNDYREKWLNPPEWVDWVITPEEEAAGFPKRPKAKPGQEANLKKRTLTNLYNARPAWLNFVHQELDKAVAAAYGWQDYTPEMTDAEILQRLLKLNLAR